MTQSKVLGGKSVAHFTCPRIQGMAFNARLHPNRPNLLPKMLLRIADDLLRHVVSQPIVRFILDGDARHRDAPNKVVSDDRRYGNVSVALIPSLYEKNVAGYGVRGNNAISGGEGL